MVGRERRGCTLGESVLEGQEALLTRIFAKHLANNLGSCRGFFLNDLASRSYNISGRILKVQQTPKSLVAIPLVKYEFPSRITS